MITANWTSKSGKKMSVSAEIVGENASDYVAAKYLLEIDGQKYSVNGMQVEGGVSCLRIRMGGKSGLITPPADFMEAVSTAIDERVAAIKLANPHQELISQDDKDRERMEMYMRSDDSPM